MPRITLQLSEIPEGTPFQPEGVDAILIRDGSEVAAFPPICPHLGLPLAKGVVRDGTLICAFHHACFDARTGRQTQPPGQGDLRRHPVTVEGETVTVEIEDGTPHPLRAHAKKGADPRRVVLVGAGAAAESCAMALREEGFEGTIEMIAPGAPLPYDRTMLSKGVLAGGKSLDELALLPGDVWAERDIARIDGRVTRVSAGRVHLADGREHAFDALLLAPGGIPTRPDLPGADLPGTHVLREPADAEAILAAAEGASSAVLVGGGFIGLEGALSLAKRGLTVTVVLREDVPLSRVVGPKVGGAIRVETEVKGVRFVTGSVAGVTGEGRATGLRMEDGQEVAGDLVILATGVRPATGAIEGAPTDEDGGVTVADDLSVPDLPGVFVAGDCARAPTPFGPARIEHWRVAMQHGRRAARSMLGIQSGPDIPFFWTALARQYRYVGHASDWDRIAFDGDPSGPFVARYVKDGRVMAALGAGRDADLAALHLEMAAAGGPIPA
ncbi:FAD-dependent oxidoreductase [Jannaschia formosa]|uniref:FAD-dependent oxidoreductase n=1 Tax=Jannaschia formosa TaxID=2259592 RepID=UPI00142FDE73|nr:FAD-dependent oxidoreductase [Jannaschia formosa]